MIAFHSVVGKRYDDCVKCWAWNVFCLFSLLVFALSVTVWVRSYFAWEAITMGHSWTDLERKPPVRRGATAGLEWCCGMVIVSRLAEDGPVMAYDKITWRYERRRPIKFNSPSLSVWGVAPVQFAGLQLLYTKSNYTGTRESEARVAAPFWSFLPAAIPPIVWLRRRRKENLRGFPMAVSCATGDEATRAKIQEPNKFQ